MSLDLRALSLVGFAVNRKATNATATTRKTSTGSDRSSSTSHRSASPGKLWDCWSIQPQKFRPEISDTWKMARIKQTTSGEEMSHAVLYIRIPCTSKYPSQSSAESGNSAIFHIPLSVPACSVTHLLQMRRRPYIAALQRFYTLSFSPQEILPCSAPFCRLPLSKRQSDKDNYS